MIMANEDKFDKLIPRNRPDTCDPRDCSHACIDPTMKCLFFRIDWCRAILSDFEEGFLHVRTRLTGLCGDEDNPSIPLVGMLHSVENMLEMVEITVMILRGDLGDANQRLEDDPVTFEEDFELPNQDD